MNGDPHGLELLTAVLAAADVPADVVAGRRLDHGMSGDLVFQIRVPIAAFAKIGAADRRISREELAREIAVLAWLDGRCGGPRLIWSGEVEGRPALLMQALEGTPLHELTGEDAHAGAVAAITALANLHALPIADCPFDERLARKLAESRRRIDSGEVTEDDFDPERLGRTAEQVWADLERLLPADEDLVVTHGDASWPNFIIKPGRPAGLVDLGRAGVADRYQDLALFARSGRRNAPELDVPALLAKHYPLADLDHDKLEFYRILDELY